VVSINLADELVIMLIFVNNENFANATTMGKVSHDLKNFGQSLHTPFKVIRAFRGR